MVQILQDRPSFGSQLAGALGKAGGEIGSALIQRKQKEKAAQQENEQLKKVTGQDLSGITDPKMRQEIVAQLLKGQTEAANKPDLSGAMGALDQLESLVGRKGIGFAANANFTDEARKNRGVFESTQAAILPLFKSMFPRGMTEKEFKFVNDHYIPQTGDTEAKIKGKIQGLRQLIGGQGMGGNMMSQQQERPPIESFER